MAVPPPEFALVPGERPVGGLGLHLVRSLAEAVHYARTDNRNHLKLKLRG
jgi:serine/threonine-protein kinase RsbW